MARLPPSSPEPPSQPSIADVLLRTASGVFSELLTVDDLLQTIMDKVIEVTRATKGFIILTGNDGEFDFRVARNMKREEIENPRNRISRNLIAQVMKVGKSVLTGDAFTDPRFQSMESVHRLLLKSLLCAPLKSDAAIFGVIYLENHLTAGVFEPRHLEMVEKVAEQAALAFRMTQRLEVIKGERDRLEEENRGLREIFRAESEFGRLVGGSPVMKKVLAKMARIAQAGHTVLLQGENGTGKDLVARLLHATGPRRDKPFVAVNCAAVPGNLFESELFGHVKGAFTGADRMRVGRVEAAEAGTLFLDEIGDLSVDMQAKLLRLLQERTFERVGENQVRKADIRVIAATNKDLLSEIKKGTFREDLYQRLNVLPIALPALRERPEDIADLADHFLRLDGRRVAGFTPDAIRFLEGHAWPGNVRELRNVVVRAAIYTPDDEPIDEATVRTQLDERTTPGTEAGAAGAATLRIELPEDLGYRAAVVRFEETYLREMIRRHPGKSRKDLAELIGMPRRTFFQRLRDLGIHGRGEES